MNDTSKPLLRRPALTRRELLRWFSCSEYRVTNTRLAIWVLLAASVLAACGRHEQERVASTPTPSTHAEFIPTQTQIDRFVAEGPDPSLRKLSVVDYWMHYKLMQATGIEKELGGEEQAIAALRALGNAYERRLGVVQTELPKMIRVGFNGEGMTSGFMGMGMGWAVGLMTGGMTSSMVSEMSDERLAQLNDAGPIKSSGAGGAMELQFAKDGSLTQSMEFEVKESGINGKVKMKLTMTACPDADGKVSVDIEMNSQMSVSGKPGTGGSVRSTFKYERYLDDDAHLINSGDGGASKLRIRMGGIENFESQFGDMTIGHERGGNPIWVEHKEQGFSIFRMDEVERTGKLMEAAELLQTIMAEVMLRGMGSSNGSAWESGRCIDLKTSSSPAKRNGVKPSSAFDLEVMPRTKPDGLPAGGTVTAALTGGSSLQPASGKTRADAKYGYAGPAKRDETASIAFESRSKRGVGKATLEFDTKAVRAYHMEGGADEFHGAGKVCDLEKAFSIKGSGVTVRFEPGSRDGGRYSYSGNISGFAVFGDGTYKVNFQGDTATSITATGPGSVKTPMGIQTGSGTEKYTLAPLDNDRCE